MLARWRDEVLLHAGILQRHFVASCITTWATASSKMSAEKAGVGDPTSKSLGCHCARLQRRRLAGSVRRQRYAAEQTVSQQSQRHIHRRRHGGRRGIRRGRRGARRHGRGLPPITIAPARPDLLVGNFSNQMLGLYHNEGNGLFVDEAPVSSGGPRQPADSDVRRLLLRLRSRRLSRHLRRQRPHRRGDRARAAQGAATRNRRCCSAIWASRQASKT